MFTNTGPFSPLAAALAVANAILRSILRLGDDAAPAPVPQQPWTWRDLCGWYSFGPGVLTDPQPRMLGRPPRSPSATVSSCSGGSSRSPRCAGGLRSTLTALTLTHSGSACPASARPPRLPCSAVGPAVR